MKFSWSLLLVSLLSLPSFADVWDIDSAHSTARFKIKHLMISNVSGEITGVKGTFTADPKDATKLKIEANLDANTINTNNADRDKHLKNEDFFNVKKFPAITFVSKAVKKNGTKLEIVGDLTLHGVKKEVTLKEAELTAVVKDPWGNQKRGFTAKTQINRKDYGITWNKALETGGVVVGDVADVELELELAQATAKKS